MVSTTSSQLSEGDEDGDSGGSIDFQRWYLEQKEENIGGKESLTYSERDEWISIFLKRVMDAKEEGIRMEGMVLRDFLKSIVNNPSIHSVYTINLQNNLIVNGVCEMNSYYHFQLGVERVDHGEVSHYELVIADNSDGKKRMAVLTAESVLVN